MTNIKWDDPDPVFFHPKFGINLEGNAPKGIPLPTYGNYGGPNISGGADPKDPNYLNERDDPVDDLDRLFQSHDDAIFEATKSGSGLTPDELVQPHATLINGIHNLLEPDPEGDAGEPVYDAGAMLYGGFTIFALTGQLATGQLAQFDLLEALDAALVALTKPHGPDDPPPYTLSAAVNDAQGYMEAGLAQLAAEEAGEVRTLNHLLSIFENQFADVLIA